MKTTSSDNKFRVKNKLGIVLLITLFSIIFAACSSPTKASSITQSSNATATTQSSSSGSYDGLNLSKLGSLTNYTAQYTDNNQQVFSNKVYSLTDWELIGGPLSSATSQSSANSYNISGVNYVYMPTMNGSSVTYSYKKSGPADAYSTALYPSNVKGFIGLTHVTGIKIVKAGSCTQAGQTGHIWETKPAAPGAVAPNISACVSDSSGAMLTYVQGQSNPIYGQAGASTTSFAIESIGDVQPITVP